jgi:hypothetical protein
VPGRAPTLALLAALAALSPGCSEETGTSCPGQPVGGFAFTVSDPGGARPFCAKLPAEGTTAVGTFQGTLSEDPALGTAALCLPGEHAEPYFGRVEAGSYELTSTGGLAVLGVCGSNCSTSATLAIQGSIDGTGAFRGTLTESFAYASGECGTCALPCEASYDLAGVP